jgi:SlyX protein
MSLDNSEQLETIELKLAYQEATIQDLNDVICRQQAQIDDLKLTCKHLYSKLISLEDDPSGAATDPSSERPPHY